MTESKVSVEAARKALDSLDDYTRMGVGVDAHGPRGMLERFITQQAELIDAAKEFDTLPLTGNFELDAHEYGPQSVKKAMRLRAALAACTPAKSEGR